MSSMAVYLASQFSMEKEEKQKKKQNRLIISRLINVGSRPDEQEMKRK